MINIPSPLSLCRPAQVTLCIQLKLIYSLLALLVSSVNRKLPQPMWEIVLMTAITILYHEEAVNANMIFTIIKRRQEWSVKYWLWLSLLSRPCQASITLDIIIIDIWSIRHPQLDILSQSTNIKTRALPPAEMLKLRLKQSSRSSFILIGITIKS